MTTLWQNILKRTSGDSTALMDDTVVLMDSTTTPLAGQAIQTTWVNINKTS